MSYYVYAGYLAAFLCLACAVWAAIPPQPRVRLREAMGARRNVVRSLLLFAGRLLPADRRGLDQSSLPLYTGSRLTIGEFRGIKVLSAFAGCLVAFVILRELERVLGMGNLNPALLLVGGVVGLIAPDIWARGPKARRTKAILRLLPEVVDLLSLCIGAGLDFLLALHRVVSLKKFKGEPLIEELSLAMQEIKLGKRRAEALKAMARRVNLPELSSFVRTIVQADRMGTPIAEVLKIHSEDVRLERLIRAERMALKAPIKILLPLIFCIMPCIGIIIGAPIFMQFMHQNPFGK